jgi:hypothetical protein
MLETFLEKWGYEVIAADGIDASPVLERDDALGSRYSAG